MNYQVLRSLVAIGMVYICVLPKAAEAGWIRDGINAIQGNRQRQPGYYVDPYTAAPLNTIDRPGFSYIEELGGGTDDAGNYHQPIRTERALGVQLTDGTYEAPAQWDRELGIRYQVQGGQITNRDYRFYPGGRH